MSTVLHQLYGKAKVLIQTVATSATPSSPPPDKYWYRHIDLLAYDESQLIELLNSPAKAIQDWDDFAAYLYEKLSSTPVSWNTWMTIHNPNRVHLLLALVADHGNHKDALHLYVLQKALILRASKDGIGYLAMTHGEIDRRIDLLLASTELPEHRPVFTDFSAAYRCLRSAFDYTSDGWLYWEEVTQFYNCDAVHVLRLLYERSATEIRRATDAALEQPTLAKFPAELQELIFEAAFEVENVPLSLDLPAKSEKKQFFSSMFQRCETDISTIDICMLGGPVPPLMLPASVRHKRRLLGWIGR